MADNAASLQQAIDNLTANILALSSQVLPGTSLDGESVDLGAELDRMIKRRDDLRKQLINEEGPAEEHVQGWC
jgi:hypothetical protein